MSKRNVYKGHRYVPKIMGEWNQEETYEGLSIVTYQGTSYTSKKHVPIGIDILNTEFWVVTGNYNAQIEVYRKDVRDLEKATSDRMDGIDMDLENVNTSLNEKIDSTKTNLQNEIQTTKSDLQSEISDVANTADANLDLVKTNLEQKKSNKVIGLISASDYHQPENMSDSDFLESLLANLEEGTLQLEGKTYNLDRSLPLKAHQILKGTGHSTQLVLNKNDIPIIEVLKPNIEYFAYGVGIHDLVLLGNNKNIGIQLNDSSHLIINNVTIYETKYGMKANNVWLAEYTRLTIRNYNAMGEVGIENIRGTSNVYTNCWVKNFKKGYISQTIYTTFNSCACDTFTDFAYSLLGSTTLNGCGAEDGRLIDGGSVFYASARTVTFNSCETLTIKYNGVVNGASIFDFNGTTAIVNGYRSGGTETSTNLLTMIYARNAAYVTDNNSTYQTIENKYQIQTGSGATVIYAKDRSLFGVYRHNGYTPIYPAT